MDVAMLFSVACSDWTRPNGLRLGHRKFHTDMLNIFPVRVMEQWNRLLREVVETPSMEMLKTCLAAYLCELL